MPLPRAAGRCTRPQPNPDGCWLAEQVGRRRAHQLAAVPAPSARSSPRTSATGTPIDFAHHQLRRAGQLVGGREHASRAARSRWGRPGPRSGAAPRRPATPMATLVWPSRQARPNVSEMTTPDPRAARGRQRRAQPLGRASGSAAAASPGRRPRSSSRRRIGADQSVARLADDHPALHAHDAPALAQHQLDHARVLVPALGPLAAPAPTARRRPGRTRQPSALETIFCVTTRMSPSWQRRALLHQGRADRRRQVGPGSISPMPVTGRSSIPPRMACPARHFSFGSTLSCSRHPVALTSTSSSPHRCTHCQKIARRSSSVSPPTSPIPSTARVTTPASVVVVSRFELASRIARPRPRSPPTHSAITAPSSASVADDLERREQVRQRRRQAQQHDLVERAGIQRGQHVARRGRRRAQAS